MKIIILLILASVIGSVAYAGDDMFDKYVCLEYDRKAETLSTDHIVLMPLQGDAKESLDENGNYIGMEKKYLLDVYIGRKLIATYRGKVLQEDVHFQFTSDDGTANFHIYLDELEESGLTIVEDGKVILSSDYECR